MEKYVSTLDLSWAYGVRKSTCKTCCLESKSFDRGSEPRWRKAALRFVQERTALLVSQMALSSLACVLLDVAN